MIEEQLKKQTIKQGFIKKKKRKEINQENSDPIIANQPEARSNSASVSDTERPKFKTTGKNTLNFAIAEEESVCKSEDSPEKQLKKTRTFKQLVK